MICQDNKFWTIYFIPQTLAKEKAMDVQKHGTHVLVFYSVFTNLSVSVYM